MYLSYHCAISIAVEKRILSVIRESKFVRWTEACLGNIAAEFNPKLQGWINYYGKYQSTSWVG